MASSFMDTTSKFVLLAQHGVMYLDNNQCLTTEPLEATIHSAVRHCRLLSVNDSLIPAAHAEVADMGLV